ncbi:MAG: hypothetical protein KC635_21765, partial [Myxococcales bacterium]|nr:hypothetical protein [Myxococcales bacterium]
DEVCNGVDDDCDGLTDAADDTLAAHACEEQRGVCAGAMSPLSLCQGGQWIGCGPAVYAGHAFPSYALDDASCDGRDNDCDGDTDEDFAPETISCGVGACAAEGTRTCVAGVPTDACTPGDAADEVCNGEDDDCDGLTDANDDTLTRPLCAEQRGVCAGATAPAGLCQGGAWGDCTVADYAAFAFPSYAVDDASCDGRDNDCDGATDEDFAAVATTCGVGACAGQTGTVTCTSEGPVDSCDALAGASAEVCNGVDDDCDGFVDNVVPGRAGASVCAALETAIASGPDAVTAATEATFTYANPLAAAHDAFECALDGGAWERCDGAPGEKTYGDLAAGTHVFLVRAVGADGAVDATPAYWAWRVDPTVPETTILVGPTDPAQSATARFVFGASVADADFLCAVDVAGAAPAEADWEACDADLVLASLDEGVHHLWVFAVSPLGVADPTPAAWTWHVDTSAPDTVITAGPEALT